MYNEDPEAQYGNRSDLRERVASRWDLFWRRISGATPQRRGEPSPLHRGPSDLRDLPRDLCRMQFARWLVEHGKLNEGVGEEL